MKLNPEERDGETYGYRPIYGNFLPGGAESDSFPEDATNTQKEFIGERIPLENSIRFSSTMGSRKNLKQT